tara:strand:+ start:3593 stop:3787 length:195 start_codon:yes stop_codon:yes gene_type:complete
LALSPGEREELEAQVALEAQVVLEVLRELGLVVVAAGLVEAVTRKTPALVAMVVEVIAFRQGLH